MKGQEAVMSRAATGGRDDWRTPRVVLDVARALQGGPIALDPCTAFDNPTNALVAITPDYVKTGPVFRDSQGGLVEDWVELAAGGLIFVNPPYSEMKAWAAKVAGAAAAGCAVMSLVAARPDTRWWRTITAHGSTAVAFWRGRLKFVRPGEEPAPAPFPSALVFHGCPYHDRIAAALRGLADVWRSA